MLLYGTVRLLAHAHLRHALYVFLHVHTYVMLRHDPSSLALALALALAHTHTHLMLRCDFFSCTLMPSCDILSCTRTDTGRYVASFFLALSNISHFLCRHLFYCFIVVSFCRWLTQEVNGLGRWCKAKQQIDRCWKDIYIYVCIYIMPQSDERTAPDRP